jgi:hypothetical protein
MVVLQNARRTPVTIPNWEKFSGVISIHDCYFEYPGFKGEPRWVYESHMGRANEQVQADFKTLEPGKQVAVPTQFVPMFPGKLTLIVLVTASLPYELQTRTDSREMPRTLLRRGAAAKAILTVDKEIPEEMQKRFSAFRKALNDSDRPTHEKEEILKEVACEKHYFAARFIRKAYENLPNGPVKEAALRHLVDLARFGTAFDSCTLLINIMGDEETRQDIRVEIMDWLGEILRKNGKYPLANLQVIHRYPPEIQEEARRALKRLADDRNPFVAAKAREVLDHLQKSKTQ